MPDPHDKVRSTFPIPHHRLTARKWWLALTSPISWAPFVPVIGAFAVPDIGPMLAGVAALLVGGGIATYWIKTHRKLDSKLLKELIEKSNAEQDAILRLNTTALFDKGYIDYALSLGSFVHIKMQIESAIHSEGDLDTQKQEIEKLVDAIAFGASDQLKQLAHLDQKLSGGSKIPLTELKRQQIETARVEISDRLHKAFQMLQDTYDNLGHYLNPAGVNNLDTSHEVMDAAIQQLKTEREIADGVRKRMRNEWAERFPDDRPDLFDDSSQMDLE